MERRPHRFIRYRASSRDSKLPEKQPASKAEEMKKGLEERAGALHLGILKANLQKREEDNLKLEIQRLKLREEKYLKVI